MRWWAGALESGRRAGWGAVATWLLWAGLVAYLGLKGGGYDPLVHDRVGIAVWWVVLVGVLIGALPRGRPWFLPLALLGGFAVWTGLSLSWTESAERSSADLALVCGYVGIFALGVLTRARGESRRLVGAVATGICVVVGIGLLSRLHPAWFPDAGQVGALVSSERDRLSYPINYWNGLAALIAIGTPLLAWVAAEAKPIALRCLAAAFLPAMALAAFFTLSRAGIAAAAVAVVVFVAFSTDWPQKILALVPAAFGCLVLVAIASGYDVVQEGLTDSVARQQGNELLAIGVAVCAAVGVVHWRGTLFLRKRNRPTWTVAGRRHTVGVAAAGALVVVVAAVAFGASGRAASAWDEFRQGNEPGSGAGRLSSAAGEHRYQYWSVAVKENASAPLLGSGAGTYEYWWDREGETGDTIRDAHSLYMQTLGELGIVGVALLIGFIVLVLAGGAMACLRAGPELRSALAAALAACVAFFAAAAFDWLWQIPVLPGAMLLLAAALVGERSKARQGRMVLPLRARIGIAAFALAAIVATAIPLSSTALVRESEADARAGDLPAALAEARSAQNVQPYAATPRLQQALVLEELGDLPAAAAAAREATERESTNWRTWLVLSRVDARRGKADAAVAAYRRALSLNFHSPLLNR